MKNYRYLVAIGMIVLMLLSIYMMISNAREKESQLHELEKSAEDFASDGLHEKAANAYSQAIEINNNIQYYVRAMEIYYEAQKNQPCIAWAERTKEDFPLEPEGYEWLVKLYLEEGYIDRAYEVIDEFEGRKLSSQQMTQYVENLKATYYKDYTNCSAVTAFSNGYIALCQKEQWGLGNIKGKFVVKPQYAYVGYCCNETIPVRDIDGTWYFMNPEGELFANISSNIEGDIVDVGLYNNGLFPVNVGGTYSYYSINLEKQFGEYDFAGSYSGGVAAIKFGEKWSLIDINGELVSENQFDDIALDDRGVCCINNTIIAKNGGAYYFYDNVGNRRSDQGFADAKCFGSDGLGAVKVDGLWGFADENGELLIMPSYFDAQSFSCGLAAVNNSFGWCYIDKEGNIAIDGSFTECTAFSNNGVAFAKSNGEWEILRLYRLNH